MGKLPLTLACHVYDRARALRNGSVPIEGLELNFNNLHVREIFWRMCQYQEFDTSEMSLGAHTTLIGRGDSIFIGVPIFPSCVFRHANMFVRVGSRRWIG